MKQNNTIKISLSTFFLLILIIIIIAFILYIYIQNVNINKQITNMEANIVDMQDKIYTLQKKSDEISNTTKEANTTVSNSEENSSEKTTDSTINIELGNYTVDEVKLDGAGVSNEECGITLKENNDFRTYNGNGTYHSGKYEIKNNTLICKSTLYESESGGYFSEPIDIIFTFNITSDNKLELTDIKNNSNDSLLVASDAFSIGMKYSIK